MLESKIERLNLKKNVAFLKDMPKDDLIQLYLLSNIFAFFNRYRALSSGSFRGYGCRITHNFNRPPLYGPGQSKPYAGVITEFIKRVAKQ
jgi:hypothetical protein